MALKLLEGFVQIFADRTALDKTLGGLQGDFQKAGTQAGQAFRQAFTNVTPQRAGGAPAGPAGLSPIQVGGVSVPPEASIFSRQGQQASQAIKLAAAAQTEATDKASVSLTGLVSNSKQAELAAIRLASGLRIVAPEASTASLQILNLVRGFAVLGPAGLAVGAALGAAAAAFLPFVTRANAALDASTKLAQIKSRGDFAGFAQIFDEAADSVIALGEAAKFAQDQTASFQGAANRLVGGLSVAKNVVAEFFGGGVKAAQEQAKQAAEQAALLFQVLERPKLQAQALRDAAALTEKEARFAQEAATSVDEQTRATNALIQAKRDQASADKALIDGEIKRLEIEKQRRPGGVSLELDTRIADARRRQQNIDRAASLEEAQIRQAADRARAESLAKDEEQTGKTIAFARRRTDAIIAAAKDLVEVEAATTLSLEQAYRSRTQVLEAQTASQIKALEEQTAAQKRALQERIAGATGDERVQLERELTNVVQEEASKRVEIETQATVQRIKLAQQERQDRIQQAQQIFAIQTTLNQRRLADELRTQQQIAQAAKEGSQIQLAAIQRVAELQAQIQNQARSVISQALSVAQQQARRLGIEGPAFVSRASLQRDLDSQRARDEDVRRRFESGQSVATEEFQNALGNQPFFEQFRGLGDKIGDVFKQAVTPLKEAFENTLGPAVTESFSNLSTKATESFASLVTNVTPAFQSLEKLVGDTMDRIVTRINAGNSEIVASITRMVEDNLTRALRDAERRS